MVRSELSDQEDHAILRVAVRNGAVILTSMPASEAQSGAKPGRRPPDRIRHTARYRLFLAGSPQDVFADPDCIRRPRLAIVPTT
jgi:hypothetical protein